MRLLVDLALTHIAGRGRQTVVSVLGVALGVGFSIAMAALMQGSQNDLIDTIVKEYPHVSVSVDTRKPRPQPASAVYDVADYSGLRPRDDRRGILNPAAVEAALRTWVPGRVSGTLGLQATARYGGSDVGVSVVGIDPDRYAAVSPLPGNMVQGRVDDLKATASRVVIGDGVAETLGAAVGSTITVSSSEGVSLRFRVVGVFNSGVSAEDDQLVYMLLKNAQTLAAQPSAINAIRLSLDDPYAADAVADRIEGTFGLDAKSWQEANQSLLEAIFVRNVIMYTVVGAILLVAGFGIFNIVSTITHEKARDIAILKSLGFRSADMRRLFLMEGLAMGTVGSVLGWGLGFALTMLLGSIRFEVKAEVEMTHLPVVVDWTHYALAALFAMGSAAVAGYLPARRAASLNPVDIIRGAT
ncbi:ABC transporter permease [Mongoliimonas terrestris]|uniref:ABC transporter permease n=1 Tax=Mongoliimonas terrestris TaxID=1709001 RepID=UPI000949905B|nr:ABC transporter permease [Mongoliimonas terrestris]